MTHIEDDTYIEDDRGHGIVMGEHYVSGYYLDKVDESNRSIKFSLPKKKCIVFYTSIKTIINGY